MKTRLILSSRLSRTFLVPAALSVLITGSAMAGDWKTVTDPTDIMQEGYIQVVGGSEAKQTRYRALRAATVVAQRDLLEAFQGVQVAGETTVGDGMLESDRINSRVKGFLRGAVKCGDEYNAQEGYAEVCMRLYLRGRGGAYDVILPLLKQEGIVDKAALKAPRFLPKVMPEPAAPAATEEPAPEAQATVSQPAVAAPPEVARPSELARPRDGLILDVSGLGFKPAIINRIMTRKGELVFGPSRVVNTVLLERGCGGFTNQQAKAKGLLATWSSKEPMELKAVEVRRGTDAVIDENDAAAIYTHDQKSSFLSQAKIVFVIQ